MSASQYPYDYMTVFMARKDMKVSPCAHFDGGIFYIKTINQEITLLYIKADFLL